MNAVLLLLQLVVATGAAAQCTVLSEIVTAASSASAALATATVVAVRLHRPCCTQPDTTPSLSTCRTLWPLLHPALYLTYVIFTLFFTVVPTI
jgi:hypothetical protein